MSAPRVSVILPTYNNAAYLAQAIESVVQQTFDRWELVIVDDGSMDETAGIVTQYDDPRIRYLRQARGGVSRARNRGIDVATGDYLAFLDGDDLFHPAKLATQVLYLEQHPEVGLTYVSRIEIDEHGQRVHLAQLPAQADLASVVLGIPFAPTDLMVRRSWITRVGGFDEAFVVNEDRQLYIRLILAGCQCRGLDQFLAYRRLHTGRRVRDLPARLDDMRRALDTAFLDPRCPPDVLAVRDRAHHAVHLAWAYQAAIQDETALAQSFWRDTVRLGPSILEDDALVLRRFLVHTATRDGGDHVTRLRKFFDQLPPDDAWLGQHYAWTVARSHLIRGAYDVLWDRIEPGRTWLQLAAAQGAQMDEAFRQGLVHQLLCYQRAFGTAAAVAAAHNLRVELEPVAGKTWVSRWQGCFLANRAFDDYRAGRHREVIGNAWAAIAHDPTYLANRGVLSILVRASLSLSRSLLRRWPRDHALVLPGPNE